MMRDERVLKSAENRTHGPAIFSSRQIMSTFFTMSHLLTHSHLCRKLSASACTCKTFFFVTMCYGTRHPRNPFSTHTFFVYRWCRPATRFVIPCSFCPTRTISYKLDTVFDVTCIIWLISKPVVVCSAIARAIPNESCLICDVIIANPDTVWQARWHKICQKRVFSSRLNVRMESILLTTVGSCLIVSQRVTIDKITMS